MEALSTVSVELELQNPNNFESIPSELEMKIWCEAAIQNKSHQKSFENRLFILIRVVDNDESAELNKSYRKKNGPTNVLSFPNDVPEFMLDLTGLEKQNSHLGDLIICNPLVQKEAAEQAKTIVSHWAHLVIHGVLHLQGFDHINDYEALEMEALEIRTLEQLGFVNPYTI